jgi:hemerythrin superfamily protein
MGLKTIPFREIEDRAGNMYEAVAAMSGQARFELQERIVNRAIMDHQEDEELDVFDEVEETSPETYEEKEKVTTVAIEKFLNGEVNWRKPDLE